MLQLAEDMGFPGEIQECIDFIKSSYRNIYNDIVVQTEFAEDLDPSLEPQTMSTSSGSSSRSTPREEYLSHPSQTLDPIDEEEYKTFAEDLTKQCQNIDKKLLGDLNLEDFRKGLLLYHALRAAQKELELNPQCGEYFHTDMFTRETIFKMIKKLPLLQAGSTEDNLGSLLFEQLITWVKGQTQELTEWVSWVSENGSRGLGSEIALVRLATGDVDLKQAIPQDDRDRSSGNNPNEIDLSKRDVLERVFTPMNNQSDIKTELGKELNRLTQLHITPSGARAENEVDLFKQRVNIITTALSVLSHKKDISELSSVMDKGGWEIVGLKLKTILESVFEMNEQKSTNMPNFK